MNPPQDQDQDAAHDRDGRRAKGQRRRRVIIDATLRVIERDGVGAVSHRNIGREADVPPASIAYYFASIDELLVATLLEGIEAMIAEFERMRPMVAAGGVNRASAMAEMLSGLVREHRGRTMAEFELYLLAARRPTLRPAARRWIEVASGYVDDGADEVVLKTLFAAIDGMLLQALFADEPPGPEAFEPTLSYLLQPVEHLRGNRAAAD